MSMNTIPTDVDCIILGTGLTNSILAAACSRVGKSVLHVDKNNYYGEDWASFTFQQLIDWIKSDSENQLEIEDIPEDLMSRSRMFCIDLCPKLLFSNGAMVDLLVKSNVSRYHEFKNNVRILSMIDDKITVLPCRRSEVFTSPLLSDLVDKRRLMKFIELCIKFDPDRDLDEIRPHSDKPIASFLEERGLKQTLREYIVNSIAMVEPSTTTLEACKRIKNFMLATERFGRSPFIFPLYGCGEFPQSFCRLSAVFCGVYCLNTQIDNIVINTEKDTDSIEKKRKNFVLQIAGNKSEIESDILVMGSSNASNLNLVISGATANKLSRAILIVKESVAPNNENLISFMRIPPSHENKNVVFLLELNSSVSVCPPDLNIVYLWTQCIGTAEEDLKPTVDKIFKNPERVDKNVILWSYYYHQLSGAQTELIESSLIANLYLTNPPSDDIDYNLSIKEAETIFHKMYPGQEFLPRAPDPEEIIS